MAGSYCNRRPWGQQKPPLGYQLDKSSPFAQGLVGCWLFNEGAGAMINDLTGKTSTQTITAPNWGNNSYYYSQADTQGLAISHKTVLLNKSFTFSCMVNFRKAEIIAGNREYLLGGYNYSTWYLQKILGAKTLRFYSQLSNTDRQITTSTEIIESAWQHIVVTDAGKPTDATKTHIYINGNECAYAEQKNGAGINWWEDVAIGIGCTMTTVPAYPQYNFQGYYGHFMMWNRQFSAEEVAYLYANPFAMVEGWNYGRYYSIASGIVFSPIWYSNSIQDVA